MTHRNILQIRLADHKIRMKYEEYICTSLKETQSQAIDHHLEMTHVESVPGRDQGYVRINHRGVA